jgi:hypothetical protein
LPTTPDAVNCAYALQLREVARRCRAVADALADGDYEFARELARLLERDALIWARTAAARRAVPGKAA